MLTTCHGTPIANALLCFPLPALIGYCTSLQALDNVVGHVKRAIDVRGGSKDASQADAGKHREGSMSSAFFSSFFMVTSVQPPRQLARRSASLPETNDLVQDPFAILPVRRLRGSTKLLVHGITISSGLMRLCKCPLLVEDHGVRARGRDLHHRSDHGHAPCQGRCVCGRHGRLGIHDGVPCQSAAAMYPWSS